MTRKTVKSPSKPSSHCQFIKRVQNFQPLEGYPLSIVTQKVPVIGVSTRAAEKGRPVEIGKTTLTQNSSISEAIKVWNQAPISFTDATTHYLAKKNIREYAKSLPV